jgi:hypothetical protein
MHLPLKELTNLLINTKRMSIPHILAISAIGLTTMATGYLAYTKIRLYEKTELIRIETMHQQAQFQLEKAKNQQQIDFGRAMFELEKEKDQHTLTFRRSMMELDNSKLP